MVYAPRLAVPGPAAPRLATSGLVTTKLGAPPFTQIGCPRAVGPGLLIKCVPQIMLLRAASAIINKKEGVGMRPWVPCTIVRKLIG